MKYLSPSTRVNLRFLCVFNGIILLVVFAQIYDVVTQLNDAVLMNWAVRRDELTASRQANIENIPKIIHQTYKTEEIPEQWVPAHQTVRDMHEDYTHILWTDASAREFIAEQYPWFLKTLDSYKYPIMRADAIRYFVLHHYGGFYIDLDIGSKKSLEDLRSLSSLFCKTKPTGVSNDFMASSPKHPFMTYVINTLEKYQGNYLIPYFTVMYSTGPLFLSILLQRYNLLSSNHGSGSTRTFLLRAGEDSEYQPLADYIFHVSGSTWHQGDAGIFTFIKDHLLPSVITITLFGFALLALIFVIELNIIRLVQLIIRRRWSAPPQAMGSPQIDRMKQA